MNHALKSMLSASHGSCCFCLLQNLLILPYTHLINLILLKYAVTAACYVAMYYCKFCFLNSPLAKSASWGTKGHVQIHLSYFAFVGRMFSYLLSVY